MHQLDAEIRIREERVVIVDKAFADEVIARTIGTNDDVTAAEEEGLHHGRQEDQQQAQDEREDENVARQVSPFHQVHSQCLQNKPFDFVEKAVFFLDIGRHYWAPPVT